MGHYLNPTAMTKREWLEQNAVKIGGPITYSAAEETGQRVVCLVDNIVFEAVALGTSQDEINAFARPDERDKEWFLIPIAKEVEFR